MCKLTSIEICNTHNHAVIKTDTRGDVYLHGEDLGVDFTTMPFEKAYAFVAYYIKSVKGRKETKEAEKKFFNTMKTVLCQ